MINEDKKSFNKGPWWKPAMEILSEVSTWIVVPIVTALVAGKALDNHYGTKPVIFLALTGFAFLVTCFGMYRVVRDYVNKLKETEIEKKKDNNNELNDTKTTSSTPHN
ncbi:MAG: AtpZ/AtpI family protein [Candidatus Paceibacterota bacterium]